MSRVPRIRFKGFEEDWEQRKLGEIADKVVEKNFQLQERDVFTNSAEFGIIDQKDFFDHEIVNKNNIGGYYIVSPNDFVYNPRISVTAPVGPINRNKLCKRGIMSPLYTVFHPRNMNETFLEFYFKTNKWHKFMEYNGDSGARSDRFSIKTELFYAMTIPFPSREEQSKVGICFESIDHLITLHQRKLEKLKIIKKSMLENLFPQNEEKTPKIRFSGFTKDWEQRKLGEYLIQYTEVTIINDQYPVLTSSRKGIFFQKDYYDGNQIASENNIGYNIVPYGYFTYRHMSDDEIFYFNINNIIDNGIVSTLYPVFTTNNRLDSKFLQYELNFGKEFRKYSALQKQGGSRTYMYFNKLRDLKLTITTSLKEQECIRNLICSIDHLITLHQSKLEKLQKIKKSMLESMFV